LSPFNLGQVANVTVRALIPIFGVVFLGWSGTKLVVVYFGDTLASMYCLMVLVMYAGLPQEPEYQAWIKDGLTLGKRLRTDVGIIISPLPFLLIVGFFFGVLPLFVMLDLQQVWWGELLHDRDMWIGVGCQFAGAVTLLVNELGWVRTLDDPKRFFKFQFGLLSLRWGAMILIGFFLAPYIPLIIYGPLLIATYAAMTAALELAPARMLDAVESLLGRLNDRGDRGSAATPVSKSVAAAVSRRSQSSVATETSPRSKP
jgi:hypothetical protein